MSFYPHSFLFTYVFMMKDSPYCRYFLFSVFLLLLLVIPQGVRGWDDDDFDNEDVDKVVSLVKAVNMSNFYNMMGVSQNATQLEIRKSFRRMALTHHPERNRDDPDATVKFQRLVSVHEVLVSSRQRDIYDRILVEGIP